MSNKIQLQANNASLQEHIERIRAAKDAAAAMPKLPELSNEGSASDLFLGKELIDDEGNKITGTFTIDNELDTQDTLITNIMTALEGKAAGGGGADPVLQSKTVTPTTSKQTITPDSGYDGLSDVTVNAMPTATQATPSISVSSAGLITASATQSAGYVASGTKSATKQLTVQAAKTITPSESSQTAVAKDRYTTGAITVAAIPDGYMVGNEIAAQDTLISQIATALQGKAAGGGGDLKYATGEFTVTSTGATITGLEFTPKHVVAAFAGQKSINSVSTIQKVTIFVQGGLYSGALCYQGSNSSIVSGVTSYGHIDILDDGFTLGTGTGTFKGAFYSGDTWNYIAIG